MTKIDLKESLIAHINEMNDDHLLAEIYEWIKLEEAQNVNGIYQLSKLQEQALEEARQSIRNGEFLTEEEANREIDEWLEK